MRIPPLFGSSSGAAWLSSQDDATIDAAISLCRRELGRQAKQFARIFQLVQRAREQGYVFGGVSPDNSTCGISFALPKARNGLVLVLTMAAPIEVLKVRQAEFAEFIKVKIQEYLPSVAASTHSSSHAA